MIYKGMTQGQIITALSTSRTVITRPFTSTGVDFSGPFDIRNYTGRSCLILTATLVYLFALLLRLFIWKPLVTYLTKIVKREFWEFLKESGSQVNTT